MLHTLVILGVMTVLLLSGPPVGAEAPGTAQKPPALLTPGQPAPAFASHDPEGQTIALDDYKQRPIILNFWATWCAPCRHEMRLIQAAYEQHKTAGLTVLAISQDQPDNAALVRAYWTSMALTFAPLMDPEGQVATQYGVFLLPSTVFIAPSGTVAAVHLGPLTPAQMERYLKTIMPQAS